MEDGKGCSRGRDEVDREMEYRQEQSGDEAEHMSYVRGNVRKSGGGAR